MMRRLMMFWLLPFILLPASRHLHAFDLVPFTATYKFNLDNKLSGTATRVLEKREGNQWFYTFSANAPLATAVETSLFQFDGNKVTPLAYTQTRKVFMVKRNARVNFDWKSQKGIGQRDGKPDASYDLQSGVLDDLNLDVQIRRDLKDAGKLSRQYLIASPKNVSEQPFVVEGDEVVATPMGKLETLRVSRVHNNPDRHTTFWLAKDYDYLPAKVMQDNDGEVYTIEITSYKTTAK